MSALVSEAVREVTAASGSDWLPGSMALLVLAAAVLSLVHREVSRGVRTGAREERAKATVVIVVPLLVCASLVLGARFLELVT